MIGIIDYGMGNIQSVVNAFEFIGASVSAIREPDELSTVDKIVLPGVGAFGTGIDNLEERGFSEALAREVLKKKKKFLGICLGMQLICRESFEFGHFNGLGWIDASVHRFEQELGVNIPHVGWNDLKIRKENRLIDSSLDGLNAYFVHSYYVDTADADIIIAVTEYGREFIAAIEKENIFAVQFHPEKSQKVGLRILKAFSQLS